MNSWKRNLEWCEKEYAKKGLLTAGVLAALMASPQLSSAQKAQVKDIAKKTTVSKIPVTITEET